MAVEVKGGVRGQVRLSDKSGELTFLLPLWEKVAFAFAKVG